MNKNIEPYRSLFPIGAVFAFAGVFLWLLFARLPHFPYPGPIHSRMMVGGFLLSFVTGFLMTAIPKMTGTHQASKMETAAAACVTGCAGITSVWSEAGFAISIFLGFSLLIFFGIRRFRLRQKPVPDFFIFIASGLGAGLSGGLLLFLSAAGLTDLQRLGQLMLFQVMVLSLVLGIGARLVPVIAGLNPFETPPGSLSGKMRRLEFALAAALLWASVIFESPGNMQVMLFLRAMTASFIAIRWWKLFARPQSKSRLAYMIKVSAALVLAGFWLAAIQPTLALHWMHLTYIGGFGLMTFTVASRVSLAHGGFGLGLEQTSKALIWIGIFMASAALTRASAPIVPNGYLSHLQYAAILWLLGVVLWALIFTARILKIDQNSKDRC